MSEPKGSWRVCGFNGPIPVTWRKEGPAPRLVGAFAAATRRALSRCGGHYSRCDRLLLLCFSSTFKHVAAQGPNMFP